MANFAENGSLYFGIPLVTPVIHFIHSSNFCQIFLRSIIQKLHIFIFVSFFRLLGKPVAQLFFPLPIRFFEQSYSILHFEKFDTEIFCVWEKKYANTQTLTQPDASDRLLTRSEVAEYLNIGTTFIEQLRRQGKLPSYRLSGKCIRYKKSDCDVLLDHCFVARPAKIAKKGEI